MMLILQPLGRVTPYLVTISTFAPTLPGYGVTARESYLEAEPVASFLEQLAELCLGALLRVQHGHHGQVHIPHQLLVPGILLARLAETVLVNQYTSTRLERRDQILQDRDGILLGKVMENPAEEVH